MQARQDIILYKRHAQDCAVHKTSTPISKRRFWFECDCPIWIEGRTPAGEIIRRQSTGTRNTEEAEAFRRSRLETPTEQHGPAIFVKNTYGDKREHLVVAPDVKAALGKRAKDTKQTLLRLVDTILRKELSLPPYPKTDPTIPEKLVPVVRYLTAVLAGKKGTRADSALITFLIQTAKVAGY